VTLHGGPVDGPYTFERKSDLSAGTICVQVRFERRRFQRSQFERSRFQRSRFQRYHKESAKVAR
jgi:hypothetical protein